MKLSSTAETLLRYDEKLRNEIMEFNSINRGTYQNWLNKGSDSPLLLLKNTDLITKLTGLTLEQIVDRDPLEMELNEGDVNSNK